MARARAAGGGDALTGALARPAAAGLPRLPLGRVARPEGAADRSALLGRARARAGGRVASRRERRRSVRRRARRAAGRDGRELGEEELVRLFRARGEERQRVFAAADRLRREVCGDEVSYVVTRNIQYTNVCYFRCGFCAFSKGRLAANLRGAPYLVPLDEIVRRSREAWERGATEVCLQGGIHPAFTGDYYASVVEAIRAELPGPAHPRVLGAGGLAGRGDTRPAARGLSRPAAGVRARLAARDCGRDPRRRGARRSSARTR